MDSFVNGTPKITVIMPVYNCELYIQEAVESILNQSFTDFEFLIIDDASTDQTVSILKKYCDSRIKLIEKPLNTGYANSLNYGLKIANGEYIARMDGDDISYPQRFAKQVSFLDDNPEFVLCGTFYKIIGDDTNFNIPENHNEIKLALLKANCIAHPTVLIRKKTLDDFSIIYDVSNETAEDYDMWVRLLQIGKLYNIQEVLLKYRIHATSVSRKRAEDQEKIAIRVKLKLLSYLDVKLEKTEQEVLKSCFKKQVPINFNEIQIFRYIKQKLILSNTDNFFEPIGFLSFLRDFEADILRKCFLRQKSYSPKVYLEYLNIKYKSNIRLSFIEEFRLLIKAIIFWKV